MGGTSELPEVRACCQHADATVTRRPAQLRSLDSTDAKEPHPNPYSESQFKTLKYRPDYPDRFSSLEDARAWCAKFFAWYNREHYHAGIALLTPSDVHHGHGETRRAQRATALAAAYAVHPERFVRGLPTPAPLPTAVWINKPMPSTASTVAIAAEEVARH